MARGARYDRQTVFAGLVAELRVHRSGTHVDQMAMEALRYERGARALVGLSEDGEDLLYHDHRARVLQSIPVTRDGLKPEQADRVARDIGAAEPWVRWHGEGLAWIHPRYDEQTEPVEVPTSQAVDPEI